MDHFSQRKYIIGAIVLVVSFLLIVRLFYLQVLDNSYKLSAENNSRRIDVEYAARGLIFDRHGDLIVYNQPSYDLMVSSYELKSFDTTQLCSILRISKEKLVEGIRNSSRKRNEPLIKQISPETYAVLQEKLYKFPGFYVKPRTLRKYSKEIAAHLLGYVGEVDERIIAEDPTYQMGDYIGISGIEKSYEKYLKGEKGQKVYLVNVHSQTIGQYQGGKYDKDAVVGKDLICTIDSKLQTYGEKLMKNYKGSVVAIEPSTGEILVLISSPTYNPGLLVGRDRTKNYNLLERDSLEPLFMRPLMANYPPGSTFKPINALIGLKENVVNESTTFTCSMGYHAGSISVGCHQHFSPIDFPQAIQHSCNSYFCNEFRRILENSKYETITDAYNSWRNDVLSFGFGQKLKSDFTNELRGFIPPSTYYDKYYGAHRWKALTIISLSIGQGEILTTPIQMANMTAAIANHGYYYTPHVVKKIEGIDTINHFFTEKKYTTIDSSLFAPVIEGMEMSVNSGGTSAIAKINKITVCGKTGTAQNPHGEDHSVFIAFAPKDNPKIAVAVYVEHGKWGASYAAPIASLMIEKYLTDSISRPWIEKRMLEGNLLKKQ